MTALFGQDYPSPAEWELDPYAPQDDRIPSWHPVDLAMFAAGDYQPPTPTLMPRADGLCLLYPGLVHSIHGESESGKSWIVQAETARVLKLGGRVLYIDFESDAGSIVSRMLELGVTTSELIDGLSYLRPESSPSADYERAAWYRVLQEAYDLCVIDGVTDSLGMWGKKSTDNDDVATWLRDFPRRVARETGAAVVLIDHVTKNADTRGRFAIGGQAKMAGLDGAAYTVDVINPLGRGLIGRLSIRVAKDRPGGVRGHAGEMRAADRTQEVAQFCLDGTGDCLMATLDVPDDAPRVFRPTALMARVSDFLLANPGASGRAITGGVQGKAQFLRTALDLLVSEGYVLRQSTGRGHSHTVKEPFSVDSDPGPGGHLTASLILGRGAENGGRGGGVRPENGDAVTSLSPAVSSENDDCVPLRPTASQDARPASPPLIRGDAVTETVGRGACKCPNRTHGLHGPDCPFGGAA